MHAVRRSLVWIACALLLAAVFLVPRRAFAYPFGVSTSDFGGYNTTTGCNGCHSGGASPNVSIGIQGGSAGNPAFSGATTLLVDPNATISLYVQIHTNSASQQHGGFNVSTNNTGGTLQVTPGQGSITQTTTPTSPAGAPVEITHTQTGTDTNTADGLGNIYYQFQWKSPNVCGGSYTLKAWGNSVNYNPGPPNEQPTGDAASFTVITVKTVCGNGTGCGSGAACRSGNCVDGVCCNSGCGGTCQYCGTGTCVTVSGAPQGGRSCSGSPVGGTCGFSCRGNANACTAASTGTSCGAAQSCTGGDLTSALACNGSGSCVGGVTTPCAPVHACSGNSCAGSCGADTDCTGGAYCCASGDCCASGAGACGGLAVGTCDPPKTQGQNCNHDHECSSGLQCVDGVCCNTAGGAAARCGGECEACNVAGHVGTCFQVTGAAVAPRTACTGSGTCGGACGSNRTACDYPTAQCAAASCDDAAHQALAASSCAAGVCPAQAATPCGPYKCNGTVCGTTCASDADCNAGAFCDTSSSKCVGVFANGGACTANDQCSSGNCIDGFCCDKACNGQCEACNVTGKEGTCSPVSGPPVGARPPCAGDGSSCNGVCDGVNNAACSFPDATVVCRTESCIGTTDSLAANCNGAGQCPPSATKDCAPYACQSNGSTCLNSCNVDSDCSMGNYCNPELQCAPLNPPGTACTRAGQCASTFCVDGVCCDRACDGTCEACDVTPGTCATVAKGAPHGTRVCSAPPGCAAACGGDPKACTVDPACAADAGTGGDAAAVGEGGVGDQEGVQPNANGNCACRAAGSEVGRGAGEMWLAVVAAAGVVVARRKRR